MELGWILLNIPVIQQGRSLEKIWKWQLLKKPEALHLYAPIRFIFVFAFLFLLLRNWVIGYTVVSNLLFQWNYYWNPSRSIYEIWSTHFNFGITVAKIIIIYTTILLLMFIQAVSGLSPEATLNKHPYSYILKYLCFYSIV